MDADSLYDAQDEMRRLALVLLPRYERMLRAVHELVQSAFPELDPDDFRLDDLTTRQFLELAASRVTMIDESTRKDIRAVLQEGQRLGLTDREIAEGSPQQGFAGLRGLYRETYRNRSQAIARTELAHAQVRAAQERYAATGLVTGVEIVEHTDTDDACARRNGLVVPLGQTVDLLHPNCRVAVIPVVAD